MGKKLPAELPRSIICAMPQYKKKRNGFTLLTIYGPVEYFLLWLGPS